MRYRYLWLWIVAIGGLMAFAPPALAQEVEQGAREVYQGAKADLKDAAITAKVKAALLSDKETKEYSIRVDTHGNGVVELSGDVPSRAVAYDAVRLARNISGVRIVRNDLMIRGHSER